MTFSVTFTYLQYERKDNFEWTLNKVKKLFVKDNVLPQVIFIDRDLAQMNALEVVFPSSTNLLHKFHISKNVRAKCNMLMTKIEDQEDVMDVWANLVNSIVYEKQLKSFTNMFARYSTFQEYVCYT